MNSVTGLEKLLRKYFFKNNKSAHSSDWYIDKIITQGCKDQHYPLFHKKDMKKITV